MTPLAETLQTFSQEMQTELQHILQFWSTYAVDHTHGGFYGRIDDTNKIYPEADKGSVLNSRILWTFSAAFQRTGNPEYGDLADRAFRYLERYFIDLEYGGVYWTVDYLGNPKDTKKQIYALAFAIYGLSEYAACRASVQAQDMAVALFRTIEAHSFDPVYTGYIEAFSREWGTVDDLRLSDKDANEKKTMNTHLHLLEAYTRLYRLWPDKELAQKLRLLLDNFTTHIIGSYHHLILFFDENWNPRSKTISFGHDIEASWLLEEAAEALGDQKLIHQIRQQSLAIAKAALEGLDDTGALRYEKTPEGWNDEKHWWPQAEAMVGFMNAFLHSQDEKYLYHSLEIWAFIKKHLKSPEGEWWWGVDAQENRMPDQDKAGLWKCPYHNSRACLEVEVRISRLLQSLNLLP
jgi:mannobiose 2-epimerase